MSHVAVIPAKGESRRIANKNQRLFHGRPIIAYSIEAARACGLFGRIIVSTDSEEIARIALGCGASTIVKRGPELCGEDVGTQEVVKDALQGWFDDDASHEFACCIYPCAPLLKPEVLREAALLLTLSRAAYVVPVGAWLRDPGQFYFGRAAAFLNDVPLLSSETVLLPVKAETAIDINDEADWVLAEAMYAHVNGMAA